MTGSTDRQSSDRGSWPTRAGPNPLLAAWQRAVADGADPAARDDLVRRFAFAIPDEVSLEAIRGVSPVGVIEIGAGTGYWARLLSDRGVDVVAFDIAPAPSVENEWFSDVPPWLEMTRGDEASVDAHADRTLVLVWPTRNGVWAADAIERYAAVGGSTVVYVGERFGGRTGDDRFHALIGETDRCWSCAYGVVSTPCICGITPLFRLSETVELPRWSGFDDDLRIYGRDSNAAALGPKPTRKGGLRGFGRGRR